MVCLFVVCLVFSSSFICSAADLTGVWNLEVINRAHYPCIYTKGMVTLSIQKRGDDCIGTVKEKDFEILCGWKQICLQRQGMGKNEW